MSEALAKRKIKVFGELEESLKRALAYEQGEDVDLRVIKIIPAHCDLPNRLV